MDDSQWNGVDGDNKKRKGEEYMHLAEPWIFCWGIILGASMVGIITALFGSK